MDVDMPNVNGVEATRQITRDLPAVRVVAMSGDWCEAKKMVMLDAGAAGCLSKAVPFEVFLQAIRTVSSGKTLAADGGQPDSV
jgi:DNA-binding NarL/FixJ family response regulator